MLDSLGGGEGLTVGLIQGLGSGEAIAVSLVEGLHAPLQSLEVVLKGTRPDGVDGHGGGGMEVIGGEVTGPGLRLGGGGGVGAASALGGFLHHRLLLGLRGQGGKLVAGVRRNGTHLLYPCVSWVTKPNRSQRVDVTYLGLGLSLGGLAAASGGYAGGSDRGGSRRGSWDGRRRRTGGGRHAGCDSFSLSDLHRLVTVDAPLLLGLAVSTGRVIVGHFDVGHSLNVPVVRDELG